MMKSITYRKLGQEEIGLDLLDTFNRYQEVKSQAFYKALGCVEAKEINQTIAENEPYDCQLEYDL